MNAIGLKAYFCAPFNDGHVVRRLHRGAQLFGVTPVSTWAESADGDERLDTMPLRQVRAIAEKNDADLASAHVVVVLARNGAGAEMFAEARAALGMGIPVVWVGSRLPLSAYREGVIRVDHVVVAMRLLRAFRSLAVCSWPRVDEVARLAIWASIEFFQYGHQDECETAHAA